MQKNRFFENAKKTTILLFLLFLTLLFFRFFNKCIDFLGCFQHLYSKNGPTFWGQKMVIFDEKQRFFEKSRFFESFGEKKWSII